MNTSLKNIDASLLNWIDSSVKKYLIYCWFWLDVVKLFSCKNFLTKIATILAESMIIIFLEI